MFTSKSISRICSVLLVAVSLLALAFGGFGIASAASIRTAITHPAQAAADLPIYVDALTGSWQDWSWNTTRNFDNPQPVHSGSASVTVTYTKAWGGLLLHTGTALSTSGYTAIRFWVHGGSTGGQTVNFHITDGGVIYPFTVQANTWLPITVPLAALGNPATLSDLFWQDSSGSDLGQPTFYLDDISLLTPILTTTTRVSLNSSGNQGSNSSDYPAISADGRYVAFSSDASDLVSGDTNGYQDVFVRDLKTGTTTRVSMDSSGAQGNSGSFYHAVSISADGRYVAFSSNASNLVDGDTNGAEDIFLHDTQTGATTRLSLDSSGVQGSGDHPSISADGRYVAFKSAASNLVSGDTNGTWDIFLRDTQTGTTTRVSVDSSGAQMDGDYLTPSLSISADGRYVAFSSFASNLVSGDTNDTEDIFLHDMQTGTTTRVSVDSSGTQGNNMSDFPSVSADGRYVALASVAGNLTSECGRSTWGIFLRDTQTDVTTCISVDSSGVEANSTSFFPSISADGRYVVFKSWASNLVSGDTNDNMDIFLRDTQTGTTTCLSLTSNGMLGNGDSYDPAGASISADGRSVAFSSEASNLVSGDTNGVRDVFAVPVTRIFALTVSKIGAGSGTVTSNLGGIDCGATCSYYFDNNTAVTLTATAASGSQFTGWSGSGCSGAGTCTVTMDAAKSVTANFTQNEYTLTITSTNGTVTRNPDKTTYHEGDVVLLIATPNAGWVFANWTGDLISTANPDSVTIHGNTSVTANYKKITVLPLKSIASNDGWILESSETSKKGGTFNAKATTFRLGDDNLKKQYLSILSFGTGAGLPDDAVITKVTLKVKKQGVTGGGNPVTTFQGFMLDVKKGFFGTTALQASDFQAKVSKSYGPFKPALSGGWYSLDLTSGKANINKLSTLSGLTQIRLRFKLDDNNNAVANYLSLFSGNAPVASRPQLIIEYYVP